MARRATLVVLDSLGIGAMPDADVWGDAGADTLGHIAERVPLSIPNLAGMGIGLIRPLYGVPAPAQPDASWGRAATAGNGKDTVAGHWELACCRVDERFAVFEGGFPPEVVAELEHACGTAFLGNVAASGTEIIERLGEEHLTTGLPILYTSADSVLQLAAHEARVPLDALYRMCEAAFEVIRRYRVARVIARPFVGEPGSFRRTEARRDFALTPPADTVMDRLLAAGIPTTSIGKVKSIYGDRGFSRGVKAGNNGTITQALLDVLDEQHEGFIFANLVDFDMLYGHRRDPKGYAAALETFDQRLPEIRRRMGPDDILILTADHGNDPTFHGSDHTREYVPVLMVAPGERHDLGTRRSLADVGATVADWLGVRAPQGQSLLEPL